MQEGGQQKRSPSSRARKEKQKRQYRGRRLLEQTRQKQHRQLPLQHMQT